MKKALIFLKQEFLEILPSAVFFFVVLHLMIFVRALITGENSITLAASMGATVSALVVSKSILIVDALPLLRWFSQKRLVYNILWSILLYVIVILLLLFLEAIIPLISKYESILTASEHLFEEIKWLQFWASGIILIIFLIIYSFAMGIIAAIGRSQILGILLNAQNTDSTEAD